MATTENMMVWLRAVDKLNHSDLSGFEDLLDEKCNWTSVGSSRNEIVSALKILKERGWKSHNVISLVAEREFLTSTAQNVQADGSVTPAVGIVRFGPDGKITEIEAFGGRG